MQFSWTSDSSSTILTSSKEDNSINDPITLPSPSTFELEITPSTKFTQFQLESIHIESNNTKFVEIYLYEWKQPSMAQYFGTKKLLQSKVVVESLQQYTLVKIRIKFKCTEQDLQVSKIRLASLHTKVFEEEQVKQQQNQQQKQLQDQLMKMLFQKNEAPNLMSAMAQLSQPPPSMLQPPLPKVSQLLPPQQPPWQQFFETQIKTFLQDQIQQLGEILLKKLQTNQNYNHSFSTTMNNNNITAATGVMEGEAIHGKILSIQSHVVHGYVGNRAAVFPLQLLGFEVDFINSVQFSNHTGYPVVKGQKLTGNELQDLYQGLEANQLNKQYTHLLTGYIGNPSFLQEILKLIKSLLQQQCLYVCDPVLGDENQLYVPKELVDLYRDEVIPLAHMVTPNQFEAQWLSEVQITDEQSAIQSIEWFHKKGVPIVVLTSAEFASDSKLHLIASHMTLKKRFHITFPKIEGRFTGTGDLFAALLLAFTNMAPHHEFGLALQKTLAAIQSVLRITPSNQELRIIEARKWIENPLLFHEPYDMEETPFLLV